MEFELLEKVAQETSFSSQCSLVVRALTHGDTCMSSPKLTLKRNREGRSLSLSPVERRSITPHQFQNENPVSVHFTSSSSNPNRIPLTNLFPVQEDNEDLNSTITSSQSLEFKDDEAWDSFSNNETTPKVEKHQTPFAGPSSYKVSPINVKHDFNSTNTETVSSKSTVPIRKVKLVPANPATVFDTLQDDDTSSSSDDNKSETSDDISSDLPNLPPPSSLVAKLFPVLKKQRDTKQETKGQELQDRPSSNTHQQKPVPSPVPAPPVISNGLNEQVKEKLMQLEKEINKFKSENATLEKIRIEKEQVCLPISICCMILIMINVVVVGFVEIKEGGHEI